MILSNLSQKKLDHCVDRLIQNGPLPQVQAVIGPVGYDPVRLQRLADLLYAWRANQTALAMGMVAQKQATEHQDNLRRQLEQLVTSFSQTAWAVFPNDEDVLRCLGLYSTDKSESMAACLSRCRQRFSTALQLDETHLARLAGAGWDVARLTAAAALVEALVTASGQQRVAMRAYNAQLTLTKQSEHILRLEYKEARQLIRVAIAEAGLPDEKEFKKLIGLK